MEVLTFRLGEEEYGINILCVQEIRGYEAPTRIANAPYFFMGVQNLRGVIVPILDLRLKFGLADAEYGGSTVTIVLNVECGVFGIVVDAVSDVVLLAADQIKPSPRMSITSIEKFMTGLGTVAAGDRQRMLILLDIAGLIKSAQIGLVAEAMS